MTTGVDKLIQVRKEIEANDPPIEVGQIWIAGTPEKVIRRVRILALYPEEGMRGPSGLDDKLWLFEELPGGSLRSNVGAIGIFPEFNLRYVCELET